MNLSDIAMSALLKNKPTAIIVYTLFGLVLAFALLYYRFPYDKLAHYLIERNAAHLPFKIAFEEIKPETIPIVFSISDVKLQDEARPASIELLNIDNILLTPSLSGLLAQRLDFTARLYQGTATGSVHAPLTSIHNIAFELKTAAIDLSRWDYPAQAWGLKLSGMNESRIKYSGDVGNIIKGKGELKIKVSNGTVDGLGRFLIPIKHLDQFTLDADLLLSDGILNLKQGTIVCRQGKAETEGRIILNPDLKNSRISLEAKIWITPEVKKELLLPFDNARLVIQGTIGHPSVNFLGIQK